MIILDAHCDSPSQMYRLRDFSIDNHHAQVDFPKMIRGGIGASFFALYIPAKLEGVNATNYAFDLLKVTERQVRENYKSVAFARTAEEVEINHSKGLISILLGLENGSAIRNDFRIMSELYERGVRYVTLTHSQDNGICDSCTGAGTWGGLSPFGKKLIPEMNRMGMMIDLAHCSDDTVRDALELSVAPLAYTHGACRALCNHKRNLPDELIRDIGQSGGVLGMSIYPLFISNEFRQVLENSKLEEQSYIEDEFIASPGDVDKRRAWENLQDKLMSLSRPPMSRVAEHIEHAVELAGIDHVGIGTDYDGIEVTADGLENISMLGALFDLLESRGFSRGDLEKLAGKNWLNLLEKVRISAQNRG